MTTKPPAPMPSQTSRLARINNLSESEYLKTERVVNICNWVQRRTGKTDLTLGDVIIYLDNVITYLNNRKLPDDDILTFEEFMELRRRSEAQ